MPSTKYFVGTAIATAIGTIIAMKAPDIYVKCNDYFSKMVHKHAYYMPHKIYKRRQRQEEIEELVEMANPFDTED